MWCWCRDPVNNPSSDTSDNEDDDDADDDGEEEEDEDEEEEVEISDTDVDDEHDYAGNGDVLDDSDGAVGGYDADEEEEEDDEEELDHDAADRDDDSDCVPPARRASLPRHNAGTSARAKRDHQDKVPYGRNPYLLVCVWGGRERKRGAYKERHVEDWERSKGKRETTSAGPQGLSLPPLYLRMSILTTNVFRCISDFATQTFQGQSVHMQG